MPRGQIWRGNERSARRIASRLAAKSPVITRSAATPSCAPPMPISAARSKTPPRVLPDAADGGHGADADPWRAGVFGAAAGVGNLQARSVLLSLTAGERAHCEGAGP